MGDWGFFCSLQFMFVQFLSVMCGVCDCCSRLTEGKVGWVWWS